MIVKSKTEWRKAMPPCFCYKLSALYYGICIAQEVIWRRVCMQKSLSDFIESE